MALKRRYPARKRTRKPYSRRRPSTRRSYAGKRRSYTKRPRTQKAILNLTSKKKSDTMLNSTNISVEAPSGSTTFNTTPAVLTAEGLYIIPWIATARPALLNSELAFPIDKATRTSTSCYMRGLKETITIATTTGAPWMWRRVCFTLKGDALTGLVGNNFTWWRATSNQGVVRNVTNIYASTNALNALKNCIFAGAEQYDWANVFNAKLDTERISVKYDKTRTFSSGNANGIIRNMRMWFPMNHNIVYDDDEIAGSVVTTPYSTTAKPGMGDYYIVDFIQGVGTNTDRMNFSIEGKLYWHEK